MARASRFRCFAFALFLVASHTALAAHAASHTDPGAVLCQLCLCQAQQSHSLPSMAVHVPALAGRAPREHRLIEAGWTRVAARAYDGRAPPRIA